MEAANHTHAGNQKHPNPGGNGMPFFKPVIQCKLTVNEPGDSFEQEADAMADKVMRMTDHQGTPPPFFKPATNHVQRKCQACEEEESHVHRKENNGTGVNGTAELDNYVGSLRSSGESLPESSRNFFEPRFGQDFSNVKIHTDSVAAKSAQSINALAYTTGNNIVFNSGQYSPESDSGKKLMAHELTHVVQQGTNIQSKSIQRAPGGGGNVPAQNVTPICTGFSPITSVTKQDGGTTTVLGLMNNNFDVFDSGPGKLATVGCVAQASNTVGNITFMAGSNGIGWQNSTKLSDCTSPAPAASNPDTPWRVGFIQTVESSVYGAKYGKKGTQVTSSGRDALNKKAPAPWFDMPGGNFGSRLYPNVAQINDTPHVTFPITHPDDSKSFLESVCMSGKFNIWLIVHHNKDKNPTEGSVDFLHFWSIDMNLSFFLDNPDGSLHPCNITAWQKGGGLTMTKGPGRGSNLLIWDQPIANSAAVIDNDIKGDPCVVKAPKGDFPVTDKFKHTA